ADADLWASNCQTDFDLRAPSCRPRTVAEFEACVGRNVALQRAAAANGTPTCQEGIDALGVLPEGSWDCVCNVPIYVGPPPADDLDRDGVAGDADRCPASDLYYPVNAAGCTEFEDRDQDGVPNEDDLCSDSPAGSEGAVSAVGCTVEEDPDQDGVLEPFDRCPTSPQGVPVDASGCTADEDSDGDGVPDAVDPCPDSVGETTSRGCDRTQDEDFDGEPNDTDRCPGTDPMGNLTRNGCDSRQDTDRDGVPNEEDACPFTLLGPDFDVSERGCSAWEDGDRDDVPDDADRCEETRPGAPVNVVGCSVRQDEDQDTVPNGGDVCPRTPAGAPGVDDRGCTDAQRETLGRPVDTLPDDAVPFVIGEGDTAITFHASAQVVDEGADADTVRGVVYMQLPDGQYLPMPRADVAFERGADAFVGIAGTVDVAIPGVDLFGAVQLNSPATARIGVQSGAALLQNGLEAPIDPLRIYVTLQVNARVTANIGSLRLTFGDEAEGLLLIDPLDPALFVRADLDGVPGLGNLESGGLGLSAQGNLPFVPAYDGAGLQGEPLRPFDGHLYVEGTYGLGGSVSLLGIAALDLIGHAVVDVDPLRTGASALAGGRDFRVGANGELRTGLRIRDLEISFSLARATADLDVRDGGGRLTVVGEAGLNALVLPQRIPVQPASALRARVAAGTNVRDLELQVRGTFVLSADAFGLLNTLGFDLRPVTVDGSFVATIHGVYLFGTINGSPIEQVRVLQPTTLEFNLPFDDSWSASMTGLVEFRGDQYQHLAISDDGIDID
ncbi:MAG: thrombospondin type 3 repeat-containing protein, partial [Myxococcales bacterium]|nr:thrombospondin type 3 repeat-containing protein [Myxococcales bacterium]